MNRRALPHVSFLSLMATIGVACLACTSSARASYDPVGSGETKITFDKSFLRALAENGVRITAVSPAKFASGVFTAPATGGKFDPVAEAGTVETEGSLVLAAGKRRIPIKSFKLRTTAKNTPFTAKVGGSQLKVATAKSLAVGRSGFLSTTSVAGLSLSKTLASRLGKKLALKNLFKPGLPLGRASTVAAPETVTVLERGKVTFSLDPALVAKLSSLFVAVNPIFPAEHQASIFTLPIFGGDLAPAGAGGRLGLSGAIEFLQLGGGQVFWREPLADLDASALSAEVEEEPSPPFAGKVGILPLGQVAIAAYAADAGSSTISGSFGVAMDPAMAQTFNEMFATPQGKSGIFVAGESLGTVSFAAQGQ
jgi:hypothetical protein